MAKYGVPNVKSSITKKDGVGKKMSMAPKVKKVSTPKIKKV